MAMTQPAAFIAKAQSQIGVVEVPDNKTIYGKFTGHDGQPWCGSFVMWCAAQIGFKGMPNCVYTPAGAEGFKGKGAYTNPETSKPQPGDIAFFSFDNKGIEHVGIIVKDNGDGTATPIAIPKLAKIADHKGIVNTSWGEPLHYNPGEDIIVRHGPGDYGVVKKDIFAQTYKRL